MHYSPNANRVQGAFNSPIKLPSMFLSGQHPQQLTQIYPKEKRVLSYLLTGQVTWRSFCASKVYSVLFSHLLVCGFFSLQLYWFCLGVGQNLTLWFQDLGELWKQHENRDEGFCSGVMEGSQMGGKLALLKPAGRYFSCSWAFEEHRTGVALFETIQKPSQGSKCVSTLFAPQPYAAMVTDKHFKLIHNVPGYSDVLLGQTFLSLPSNPPFSTRSFPEPLCVFIQHVKLKNYCNKLLEKVFYRVAIHNPLWRCWGVLTSESRFFPFMFKESSLVNNNFPACSYCSVFVF